MKKVKEKRIKGLIIINNFFGDYNLSKISRFKEEGKKYNIDFLEYINDGTLFSIIKNQIVLNLPKADFVIFLDKDLVLSEALEKKGYRLYNSSEFIRLCDDKRLTALLCAGINIKTPKTIFSPLVYYSLKEETEKSFLEFICEEISFPMIAKKSYGSQGKSVFKLSKKEDLINFFEENYHLPLIFEEYISSSYGKSVRILVIDNKIIDGFVRVNKNDFRSNFSSDAYSIKLNEDEKKIFFGACKKIIKKIPMKYAGLDFLFGENNEPILCEINSNAFFKEFEFITKINVADLFLKMIIKDLKNKK